MIETLINALAIYLVTAYLFLNIPIKYSMRDIGFAGLNTAFCVYCFFYAESKIQWLPLTTCLAIVSLSYAMLYWHSFWPQCYFIALATPILTLVLTKAGYLPAVIGLSYLTFRLSYLVYEVHTGRIAMPTLFNYYGFALFPLTFLIGPISPYRFYEKSLRSPDREITPLSRSLMRILVGMIKVFFIAQIFETMDFNRFWFDGYYHGLSDFAVACISSYIYLYLNFSGACDLIIGAAGILNIRVKENFANPLLARNIREFWSRFHITLSDFMRDIVFTPGQLWLTRLIGRRWLHIVTVFMLMVTFFLIGMWHGTGLNFIILGLLHGVGMVVFYIYAVLWKKLPIYIQKFSGGIIMKSASTLLTFSYVSFTSLFFENDWTKIKQIYSLLLW